MSTRVAFRYLSKKAAPKPNLGDVLQTLKELQELDKSLSEFTTNFKSHFAATGLNPEVSTQTQALIKARAGLKQAKVAKAAAETIVTLYPEDKTAVRAVQAADTMVKRFDKHEAEAQKIIKSIAKKEMPADLKKAAKAFKTALAKRLVNPGSMEEFPWVSKTNERGILADYQYIFLFSVGGAKKEA